MARGYRCDGCGTFVEGNAEAVVQEFRLFKRGNKVTERQVHVGDWCDTCFPGREADALNEKKEKTTA